MISMRGVMLPNTNTHNLTQVTHRFILDFVLLCALIGLRYDREFALEN